MTVAAGTAGALGDLVARFQAHDRRALAQAVSLVEDQTEDVGPLLRALSRDGVVARPVIGLTGAPGAGKSTLLGALIAAARGAGRSVGVIAVDPSSPFTGGALLGDRVRMSQHTLDPDVFVRSMGSRGHAGGLSPSAGEAVWLLGAFGFDEVIVETVGAGQSECEVRSIADTTVVVLTPGMGDALQWQKAGLMEVADVLVVNKADLPGAQTVVRELRQMLDLGPNPPWRPPIVPVIASRRDDESHGALWEAIAAHRAHLSETEAGRADVAARLARAAAALVAEEARTRALHRIENDARLAEELVDHRLPFLVAERLRRAATPS